MSLEPQVDPSSELLDKRGNRFRLRLLRGEVFWHLYVDRRGLFGRWAKVGVAQLLWHDFQPIVALTELRLDEPYRSLGLGSKLLTAVIEVVRSAGGEQLVGDIAPKDLANTPHLLDIYSSFGFAIGPPKDPRYIASIQLLLTAKDG